MRITGSWCTVTALYNACAAGHGVRLVEVKQAPPPPARRDDLVSDPWLDKLRLKDYPRW
jgi:hypothetical protein